MKLVIPDQKPKLTTVELYYIRQHANMKEESRVDKQEIPASSSMDVGDEVWLLQFIPKKLQSGNFGPTVIISYKPVGKCYTAIDTQVNNQARQID